MKKGSRKAIDELRPEYKRLDFGNLVRGKYAARVAAETNVVVLEPSLAEAFPNAKAVNGPLCGFRCILHYGHAMGASTGMSRL